MSKFFVKTLCLVLFPPALFFFKRHLFKATLVIKHESLVTEIMFSLVCKVRKVYDFVLLFPDEKVIKVY